MTESVLSSEEIEALRDVASGAALRGPEEADLGRTDRSLRRHSAPLERRLQAFGAMSGERLARVMRCPCQCAAKGIDLLGPQMGVDIVTALVAAAEARDPTGQLAGFVGADWSLCDALIDRAFGAPARTAAADKPPEATPGKLTPLALKTLTPTLTLLVDDLAASLSARDKLSLTVSGVFTGADIELPSTLNGLFVWRGELSLGGRIGSLTVALFPSVVDLVCGRHLSSVAAAPATWIARHVQSAQVGVSAVLGTRSLTMAELLSLRPGDVVRLDRGRADHVPVEVEGVVKFMGQPTQRGGTFAVAIETEVT
jgi:flagellar motor switch protein FliM